MQQVLNQSETLDQTQTNNVDGNENEGRLGGSYYFEALEQINFKELSLLKEKKEKNKSGKKQVVNGNSNFSPLTV